MRPAPSDSCSLNRLEIVAKRHLENTGTADDASEFAEGLRRRQGHRRIAKVHIVENVVAFDTGRDRVTFVDAKALYKRHVGIEVTRSAEGIAARVAEVAGRGE